MEINEIIADALREKYKYLQKQTTLTEPIKELTAKIKDLQAKLKALKDKQTAIKEEKEAIKTYLDGSNN